jgi:hypothetical protein
MPMALEPEQLGRGRGQRVGYRRRRPVLQLEPLAADAPRGGDHLAFSLYGQTRFEVPGAALTVGGTGGQPKFTLRVSVNVGNGIVDVRDASGSRVQTLTCPLDVPPFAPGQQDARKGVENSLGRRFVNELVAEDYNFDGYVDLRAPREYAASFQNYCVWLYDPASRTFVHDGVAQKMDTLENFRVDWTRHLIVAGGLSGGIGEHSEEYRIVRGQGRNRPGLSPSSRVPLPIQRSMSRRSRWSNM